MPRLLKTSMLALSVIPTARQDEEERIRDNDYAEMNQAWTNPGTPKTSG